MSRFLSKAREAVRDIRAFPFLEQASRVSIRRTEILLSENTGEPAALLSRDRSLLCVVPNAQRSQRFARRSRPARRSNPAWAQTAAARWKCAIGRDPTSLLRSRRYRDKAPRSHQPGVRVAVQARTNPFPPIASTAASAAAMPSPRLCRAERTCAAGG